MTVEVVNLSDRPSLQLPAAKWFASKWEVAEDVYLESIQSEGLIPSWFVVLADDEIIAGAGVIENDFHDRPDLAPNICALYVEPDYRGKRISEQLLNHIEKHLSSHGIAQVYLITDHEGLYEKYGWSFVTTAKEDETNEEIKLYGKSI